MVFDIHEYLEKKKDIERTYEDTDAFYRLCADIKNDFFLEWEASEDSSSALEMQRRAIIGHEKEKNFFFEKIRASLRERAAENTAYPLWYEDLVEGIYHEVWGLAGMAQWFDEAHKESSSAKIIGKNIFFMEDGHMVRMAQTISEDRKEQMIRAFLLNSPEKRMDKDYYEIYLLDGTRVTAYLEPMAKKGCSSIVFRRYLVPNLSFEEQAKRGTIPKDSIQMLKAMAGIGFNVAFLGAVRTAKTTFLSTFQSYEDPSLEGVMVETDPEIPMDRVLPGAPLIQLLADGDKLLKISKSLLRSDADYFIMAEARDGIALDTVLRLASKGTKRMKITFHTRDPKRFPLEVATEIVKSTGGDLPQTIKMAASAFDYLFHFIQLSDKNQKRLKGIYQIDSKADGTFSIESICEYDPLLESWAFKDFIGEGQRSFGLESDPEKFMAFESELKKLAKKGYVK